MTQENEIILYQPDSSFSLEVRIEDETVWLTQQQIADLFGTKRPAITKHLNNIFLSGELDELSVCSILEHTATDGKTYRTKFYNLDAILSVGYRVNSKNATLFRQWANRVLKTYLLHGYAISQRFERLEYRMAKTEEKIDFVINSSIKPKELILFEGQIWDAHNFATDLIKQAKERIILIDNYVDNTVLTQLDNRENGVKAKVYTGKISPQLKLDIERHNQQYPLIEEKKGARCT